MTMPADGRGPTAGSRDCRWTERTDITQVTGRRGREPLGSAVKESDRWTWEGQQDAEHTERELLKQITATASTSSYSAEETRSWIDSGRYI